MTPALVESAVASHDLDEGGRHVAPQLVEVRAASSTLGYAKHERFPFTNLEAHRVAVHAQEHAGAGHAESLVAVDARVREGDAHEVRRRHLRQRGEVPVTCGVDGRLEAPAVDVPADAPNSARTRACARSASFISTKMTSPIRTRDWPRSYFASAVSSSR